MTLLEHRNALGLRVQSRVLDCDGRLSGERGDSLLVVGAEFPSGLLLGQIQIAQRRPAPKDRRPEEAAHWWVVRWKPDRGGVVLDIAQAQCVGLTLKESKQPQAVGQLADQRTFLVGDPRRDELFDGPTLVKHAERGVPGARYLPGLIHDPLKHRRAIELRGQRHASGVERAEANRLLAVTRLQGGEASEQNGGEAEHACDANSEHHEVRESRGHRRLEDEIVETDERGDQDGREDEGGEAQARRQRGPRLRSVRQASDYRRANAERSGSLRSSLYAVSRTVMRVAVRAGAWRLFRSSVPSTACRGAEAGSGRARGTPRSSRRG